MSTITDRPASANDNKAFERHVKKAADMRIYSKQGDSSVDDGTKLYSSSTIGVISLWKCN